MAIIKTIEVKGLLGYLDLTWNLHSGVNILSGGNGSGKSTLLRALGNVIIDGDISKHSGAPIEAIDYTVQGGELTPRDIVIVDRKLGTLDYRGAEVEMVDRERFMLFCDIFDEFLSATPKRVDRAIWHEGLTLSELSFTIEREEGDIVIAYEWLSAGEQLALSLLWAVAQRPSASVLILDEPEISLSIEWQRIFLHSILRLSPELQIIVATHSPALIMCGWLDRVTEIEDIIN